MQNNIHTLYCEQLVLILIYKLFSQSEHFKKLSTKCLEYYVNVFFLSIYQLINSLDRFVS